MMDMQLDMHLFHELLADESADEQLIIALKELLTIEAPESVDKALQGHKIGVWSGWSM